MVTTTRHGVALLLVALDQQHKSSWFRVPGQCWRRGCYWCWRRWRWCRSCWCNAVVVSYDGGAGGAGLANSITGSSVTRAGGGGGSGQNNGGAGGAGGGGSWWVQLQLVQLEPLTLVAVAVVAGGLPLVAMVVPVS